MEKIVVIGYGILMIVGGFIGFKAGSKVSLIMGVASGVLTLAAYAFSLSSPKAGFLSLAVIGGILSVAFLQRFLVTHKMMPGGMLLAVSVLFFLFCLVRFLKIK